MVISLVVDGIRVPRAPDEHLSSKRSSPTRAYIRIFAQHIQQRLDRQFLPILCAFSTRSGVRLTKVTSSLVVELDIIRSNKHTQTQPQWQEKRDVLVVRG